MNLIDNNTCSFCHAETESRIHLFVSCDHVNYFWNKLHFKLNSFVPKQIKFNEYKILFGFPPAQKRSNHITIAAKIYMAWCKFGVTFDP